jgi:DNA-binding transcriptional regulator PaaX
MHKKGDIAYIALGCVAVAGVLVLLPVAPGLGMVLKLIDPNPRKAAYKMDRALRSLAHAGKVQKTKEGYRLTSKGELELARRKFEQYQFPELKKWDKKWRVICFDIPEKYKRVRYVIQGKLVEVGCYRLQDSVFVTPQRCGELLKLMHEAFSLQKHVRGMVVTQIDDQVVLLRHFGL